jgi:hypothetical protein
VKTLPLPRNVYIPSSPPEYTKVPNAKEEEERRGNALEVDFPLEISTSWHLNTHEILQMESA